MRREGVVRGFEQGSELIKARFYKIFKKHYLLERREGREKERERDINVWLLLVWPLLGTWPASQACALTGN